MILCGTDLSPRSDAAIRTASLVARRLAEPLMILHVLEDLGAEMSYQDPVHEPTRARLAALVAQARALGAEAESALLPGSAPVVLARAAASEDARLVVVATGGDEGVAGLLGSVADKVARTSAVPVLTLRDAAPIEAWLRGERTLRVVVGAEVSESSRSALRQLQVLRRMGPVDVTVARVISSQREHERLALEAPREAEGLHPEAARALQLELEELVGTPGGEGALELVVLETTGGVARRLVTLAEQAGADLIVVGAHRRSIAERFWRASRARDVLKLARTSVLTAPAVAPPDDEPIAPVRAVLVGSDFSDASVHATRQAVALLPPGGTLHLVHVRPPRGALLGELESAQAGAGAPGTVDEAQDRLARSVPRAAATRGLDVQLHVLDGAVAEQLCSAADRLGADMLCVGSARASGLSGAVLGSVAQKLLGRARRPVLVVKPLPL